MAQLKIERDLLSILAREAGLQIHAVAALNQSIKDTKRLEAWLERGQHGSMTYLERHTRFNFEALFPGAKSLVTFALHYDRAPHPLRPEGYGRVARYAWGKDYHIVLKERLEKFVQLIKKTTGETFSYKIFSDSVPLLERSVAAHAGLGFIGKNTMLIRFHEGSFFFLAEVLWDIEVDEPKEMDGAMNAPATCGSCTRCIDRCPTSAFVDEFNLDARRCISYLSIEKRGVLTYAERTSLGEWVFGCDVCQEVCPYNFTVLKKKLPSDEPAFSESAGVGPLLGLAEILAIRSNRQFEKRFHETPLLRPRRAGLLRNAACVAANTNAYSCIPILTDALEHDSSALVRLTALWALVQILRRGSNRDVNAAKHACELALRDPDTLVRAEARMLLEPEHYSEEKRSPFLGSGGG